MSAQRLSLNRAVDVAFSRVTFCTFLMEFCTRYVGDVLSLKWGGHKSHTMHL